jgi:hypothetical protein
MFGDGKYILCEKCTTNFGTNIGVFSVLDVTLFFNRSIFFTFIRNFTLSCLVCCVVTNNTMRLFQSFYIKILHRLCWGATYVSRPTIATQYRKGICSVLSKWSIFLFSFTCVLTIAEQAEGVSKKPNVAHVVQCRYRKSICSLLNRYYYGDI